MKAQTLIAALGLVATLTISQSASAREPTAAEVAANPERSPYGGQVVLDTSIGTGTFISDRYSDDPYFAQTLQLAPTYRLDGLPLTPILSVGQSFTVEYTSPDNRAGRHWDYSDTSISLSSASIWSEPTTGINLQGSVSLSLPISFRSRAERKFTTLTIAPNFSRTFGDFYLSLSGSLSKSFHKYSNLVVDEEDVTFDDGVGARCRTGEQYCGGGRFLTSWSVSATGMVAYTIMPKLSATMMLGWSTGWTYGHPKDEFTSPVLEDAGSTRLPDYTLAALDLSYAYNEMFTFSAGLVTRQPALTSDQSGFRFPFYDGTPHNNFTSFYFDVVSRF